MDKLSFKFNIDVKKEYRNISKTKRKLTSVIYNNIKVYINELELYNEEVFVVDVFFDSLISEGKFPMFTCTCGIFECGGCYVDVLHKENYIIWIVEENSIEDRSLESSNRFRFSWTNIISFSEDLAAKLKTLNDLMIENGYKCRYDIEYYRSIIEKLKCIHG